MKGIEKGQIKLIHVLKTKEKLSDEEYRTLLKNHFGVSSSKELTSLQGRKLIKMLQKVFEKDNKATLKQLERIKKLSEKLYPIETENRLMQFIKNNLREEKKLMTLNKKEASKIIYQLEEVEKWKASRK